MPESLRAQVVRLAHTRPELREHLLPILMTAEEEEEYNTHVGFNIKVEINKVLPIIDGTYLFFVSGRVSMRDTNTNAAYSWPLVVNIGKNKFLSNLPVRMSTSDEKKLGEILGHQIQDYVKTCVQDVVDKV